MRKTATDSSRRSETTPKATAASPDKKKRTQKRNTRGIPESNYGWTGSGVNLDDYAPAYFTFIANKLASGAATAYRKYFGVGIEVWRVLFMLALEEKVSVNMVCRLIGMDKGSVSRCFKLMYEQGLITFSHDPLDGRVRYATLTARGRQKHDEIKALALEREREFLSCLSSDEVKVLVKLLHRLHAHLPNVESATRAYIETHVTTETGKDKGARAQPRSEGKSK